MSWVIVVLAALMVVGAIATVLVPALLYSAIGLAATSVALSVLMFQMDSPLAAVFELSVCAGLITVVFVSAISLTKRTTPAEERVLAAGRTKRFIWLPVLAAAVAAIYLGLGPEVQRPNAPLPLAAPQVRDLLWNVRRFDLLGQMLLLLGGVFGVVVLFKGCNEEKK
jgi:NADH-quinone oxidoreductase subunit J